MPRPIWKGAISFGLVSIPIKLYPAIKRKEITFHFLHRDCGTKLIYQKYCPFCKREVEWDEVVRGYEYEKGKYVILEEKDFEKLDLELTRRIDIIDFVKLEEIDPILFEKPYYLIPEEGGEKAYFLLKKALEEEEKVGIAKVAIKNREYLCALKVRNGLLTLETMYFINEVIDPKIFEIKKPSISQKELKLAKELISKLTAKFEPEKYTDEYRKALMELIRKKIKGKEIKVSKKVPKIEIKKLVEALEESMKEIEKIKKE